MSRASIVTPAAEAVAVPRAVRHRNWPSEVGAVFVKALRSEFRTRSAIFAILLFAMTTLVVVSFTVPTHGLGLDQDRDFRVLESGMRRLLLSALLWLILF